MANNEHVSIPKETASRISKVVQWGENYCRNKVPQFVRLPSRLTAQRAKAKLANNLSSVDTTLTVNNVEALDGGGIDTDGNWELTAVENQTQSVITGDQLSGLNLQNKSRTVVGMFDNDDGSWQRGPRAQRVRVRQARLRLRLRRQVQAVALRHHHQARGLHLTMLLIRCTWRVKRVWLVGLRM